MKLWTLVVTAAALATAVGVWRVWRRNQDEEDDDDTDEVDLASDQSFPASDPPSFTVGRP
jgi:hypothetical protein